MATSLYFVGTPVKVQRSAHNYQTHCSLATPALVFVTPNGFCKDVHTAIQLTKEALAGGTSLVQIRDRQASPLEIQNTAWVLLESDVPAEHLSLNGLDPSQVRAVSKHIGLHIREAHIPKLLLRARNALAEDAIISCSVHSLRSALAALEICEPSYMQVGTMFPTNSHPGKLPEGPQLLRCVREHVGGEQKLIAIGGITKLNVDTVFRHGADGIAVISSISNCENPRAAASDLVALCHDAYSKMHDSD